MAAWSDSKGAVRPPSVRVSDLLSAETIIFGEAATTRAALLDALIDSVRARHGLPDKAELAAKVHEREKGISTTLDTGVSLPHARLDGISGVVAGLALPRGPLVDPGSPEIPVRAIFLFFSPNKQEYFGLHLQVLRGAAALFTPALLVQLAAAKSPQDALALLRSAEKN